MTEKLNVSRRSHLLEQSEIRHMTLVCAKMNGINMAQGVCDLPLAEPLKKNVQIAVEKGFNCYTRFDGIQMLREAIAEKSRKHNDIACDPDKNIIVSSGSTGVFYSVCMALFDADDEVIVPEPYYGYHVNSLIALGITPKFFRLDSNGWTFDKNKLESFITSKTKAIIINTPGNPSGKVFSKKELDEIAGIAIKHNIFILTDEIYEYFIYGGKKHISPASIPEIKDRTITISGYSKTFSITGWRVGYCICHEKWAATIGHINDLIYVCAPAPLQYAVAAGIKAIPDEYYEQIKVKFQSVRDKVCSALNDAGLTPHVPDGAYYILCDASKVPGGSSREKAFEILKKTGVASVPGSAFYHDSGGDNLVRFCFAKNDDIIENACQRLKAFRI